MQKEKTFLFPIGWIISNSVRGIIMDFLENVIDIIDENLKKMCQQKKIVVWGAGKTLDVLMKYSSLFKYEIQAIVDTEASEQKIYGKQIECPANINWDSVDVVVVTPFFSNEEISYCLKRECGYVGIILFIRELLSIPLHEYPSISEIYSKKNRIITQRNFKLKGKHKGEEVFILCTGPSLGMIDIEHLRNKNTIAVGSFCLHEKCSIVNPNYYCVPTFEEEIPKDVSIERLLRIRKVTNCDGYFYSIKQKEIVDSLNEYDKENVYYLDFKDIRNYQYHQIDLEKRVMQVQSVSIMALEIAIYMGFSIIYLLGTDHDVLTKGEYKHCYNNSESIVNFLNEDKKGNLVFSYAELLECEARLWKQYKIIKNIADNNGIKIYNATVGGNLDVFERREYLEII